VIRAAEKRDAEAIANIYNHYIANTIITFEEETIDAQEMAQRISDVQASGLPWLVVEDNGHVVGYAYASKWKGRCAYRFSVESSVYVSQNATSKGLGSKLYDALFIILKERSVHVAIGGIALPNEASIALHEKFGMNKVAHFSEVGFKFNRWLDVGYWQKTFEV
jgi:L-amino acid N-acyltransferase YncA